MPRDVSPGRDQTLTQPASTEPLADEMGTRQGAVNLCLDAGARGGNERDVQLSPREREEERPAFFSALTRAVERDEAGQGDAGDF